MLRNYLMITSYYHNNPNGVSYDYNTTQTNISCQLLCCIMKLTRKCEHCNAIFTTYPNELARGRGQFCSKKCAGPYCYHQKHLVTCPTCQREFYTFTDVVYCSIECEHNE